MSTNSVNVYYISGQKNITFEITFGQKGNYRLL